MQGVALAFPCCCGLQDNESVAWEEVGGAVSGWRKSRHQVRSGRQGQDLALMWDPSSVPRQPVGVLDCLDLSCQNMVAQIRVDPLELLLCYPGQGETFPLPWVGTAAAQSVHWISAGMPAYLFQLKLGLHCE